MSTGSRAPSAAPKPAPVPAPISASISFPDPTAGRIGILHRIFSFPVALCGLLVLLSVATVRSRFDDPDMWWHLRMGEVICRTRTIPTTDIFSWTTNHHAWTAHEWLAQVLIYGAYAMAGYTGLMLWLCCLTAALLIAGYLLCRLYSGNAKVSYLGALLIWLFSTVGLAVRPQMIGYLLLVVELLLIELGRTRNPRWFFGLPPLFALWVNCHGSFFLGLIVAAIYLSCSFFNFKAGSLVAIPWDTKTRLVLAVALGLSIAALFLNPNGVQQVLYPLNTMISQPIGLSHVEEWQPLQLSGERGGMFLALIGSVLLVVIVRRSEIYWHELLLLVAGVWLAGGHQRMLFVLGILAAPVVSRLLADAWDGYDPAKDRILPNALLLGLTVAIACWAFPSRQSLASQVDEHSPVKAVEFMKASHLSGHMLNEYVFGGYLIWAAPEYPVFVDGRADVFEWAGVLGDFGSWASLRSDPTALLDKYGVDFCLLGSHSPMARVLPLLHNWRAVYADNTSVIFVRDSGLLH